MTHHLPMTAHHSDPGHQIIDYIIRGAGYKIGAEFAIAVLVLVVIYTVVKRRKDNATDQDR